MRRTFTLLVIVLGLFATTASPAQAITGDYVEDNEHPFVGLVVFYDDAGEFIGRCSGSLLTPTVFLTAGHCTDGATSARVYFQQDAGANYNPETGIDPVSGYPESCADGTEGITCATSDELYTYHGYDGFATFPNTGDVGLVILDQPITVSEYGVLAEAGSLDRLATRRGRQDLTFTSSGYGLTRVNPVFLESYRSRLMATSRLTNLRSALTDGFNLQLNGNGTSSGGTCFGDSGGPVFYGGYASNTIVAVTSFGLNGNCAGVDFAFRTDQTAIIEWILDTVAESSQPQEAKAIQIVKI